MARVETPVNCRWLIAKDKSIAMPVLPKCGSTSLKTNEAFLPHVSVKEVLSIPVRVAWLRNPIDRLYSCWCNFHMDGKEVGTGKSLSNWGEFVDLVLGGEQNVHWNPQVPQLTYEGEYIPTITERFENLSTRFNYYLPGRLARRNTSKRRSVDFSYRLKDLEFMYQEDFELWETTQPDGQKAQVRG